MYIKNCYHFDVSENDLKFFLIPNIYCSYYEIENLNICLLEKSDF